MACPDKVCDLTALTATLSGSLGTFTFTEYVDEGDLVSYGDTEFISNEQYSNTSNLSRFSGQSIPKMTVTINAFPCDDTWEALYQAHIGNTRACFGTLVVNDPCCKIRTFNTVTIVSMSPPNVSTDTTVAPVVLKGIPTG